jgi:hypothetical protein
MDLRNCGGLSAEKRPQTRTQNAMGYVQKSQREAEESISSDILTIAATEEELKSIAGIA